VTDELKAQLQTIGGQCDDLLDEIEASLDEHAEFSQQLSTSRKVVDTVRRFREIVAPLGEMDRMTVDRTVGRKIIDIQKMAVRLPAPPAGSAAPPRADDSFFATRVGDSSRKPRVLGAEPGAPKRGETAPKYRVTGEVEAWCGPCDQVRTHVIIAIVDDLPAQVVCQACNSRHKFREGPARKKAEQARPAASTSHQPTAAEREAQKRAEEKKAHIESLRAVENPRTYDPKERYKVGEVIEHVEHGRGKIENTLPRSLLVRFVGGLKQLPLR
jgi:hypothetical protein